MRERADGAMLRWNSTQIGQSVFVHASADSSDAQFTIVPVLQPEYRWQTHPYHSVPHPFVSRGLELRKDSAVALDLPFAFPFFGLQHRRVWVSSFGMVLFEDPHGTSLPSSISARR